MTATTPPTIDEQLRDRGWIRDGGSWIRPQLERGSHVHSASCTDDSCGDVVFFCQGGICLRLLRRTEERRPCDGHRVPTRAALVEYSLNRKGLTKSSPAGTPLEDEPVGNTWSNER